MGDLGVGIDTYCDNEQLHEGIWQFQKLFGNHERHGITGITLLGLF